MEEDKGGGKERADQVTPVEEKVVVKCGVVVGSIGGPRTDRSTDRPWVEEKGRGDRSSGQKVWSRTRG